MTYGTSNFTGDTVLIMGENPLRPFFVSVIKCPIQKGYCIFRLKLLLTMTILVRHKRHVVIR